MSTSRHIGFPLNYSNHVQPHATEITLFVSRLENSQIVVGDVSASRILHFESFTYFLFSAGRNDHAQERIVDPPSNRNKHRNNCEGQIWVRL